MTAFQGDHPLPTFVSFADREADRDFVRLLLPRLNEQPLRVWNYHREGDEIPIGTPIGDHLKRMIEQSRVFVVVLSSHALRSWWVEQEVVFALDRQRAGLLKVIPVVSRELAITRDWPGGFRPLADLCAQPIDFGSPEDLEVTVQRVCRTLAIDFLPLIPEHPRLPYRTRFLREFRDACEAHRFSDRATENDRGTFEYLMRLLGQFGAAARDRRTPEALRAIRLFCLVCEHEFPHFRLYYPSITQGVWEILSGELEGAERTFERVMARGEVDESVYSALGHLSLEKGEYARAEQHYRTAHRLCPSDSAAEHGAILAAALQGKPSPQLDAALARFDADSSIEGADRVKIDEMKGLAWKVAGRVRESERVYADLAGRNAASPGAILHYAELLQEQGRFQESYDLLRKDLAREADAALLLEAARMAAHQGDLKWAETCLGWLRAREPRSRQYVLELAMICRGTGDHARAQRAMSELLRRGAFDAPRSADDFYCDGAAQWLCGDHARAQYDFERSGYDERLHYARVFGR